MIAWLDGVVAFLERITTMITLLSRLENPDLKRGPKSRGGR